MECSQKKGCLPQILRPASILKKSKCSRERGQELKEHIAQMKEDKPLSERQEEIPKRWMEHTEM